MERKKRIVMVTGASGGIGHALVEFFLAKGCDVVAVCGTHEIMPRPHLRVVCANLNFEEEAQKCAEMAGAVDVLVCCAGAVSNSLVDRMSQDTWRFVMDGCLTTAFTTMRVILPGMRERKSGHVVVLGSIVGDIGGRGCANYAAAKAGLKGLVRGAANDVAGDNVLINLLTLGYIDSGMGAKLAENVRVGALSTIPLKRFGSTLDVAQAVEFLATQNYMTGNELVFAGGLR